MTTGWLIAARAVHFAACLLFFGTFAFDRYVAGAINACGRERLRVWGFVLLPVMFVSGLAWFISVTATMAGTTWFGALQPALLKTIWTQTQFGGVWRLRLMIWIVAMGMLALSAPNARGTARQKFHAWVQLLLSALLLGSLAWAGHGLEGSRWHLWADVLHLLVAGIWPTGLLPFFLELQQMRNAPEPTSGRALGEFVRRFSALSLASVALLTITGLVNSWALVGSFSNLIHQPYGRFLLVKLLLFIGAVSLGAVNLLRLKPQLRDSAAQQADRNRVASWLRFNMQVELALGTLIIIVVAVLGLLPPSAH